MRMLAELLQAVSKTFSESEFDISLALFISGGDQDLQTAGEQAAAGAQHQAGGAHRQGNNP